LLAKRPSAPPQSTIGLPDFCNIGYLSKPAPGLT
jgi:hypothetical protein